MCISVVSTTFVPTQYISTTSGNMFSLKMILKKKCREPTIKGCWQRMAKRVLGHFDTYLRTNIDQGQHNHYKYSSERLNRFCNHYLMTCPKGTTDWMVEKVSADFVGFSATADSHFISSLLGLKTKSLLYQMRDRGREGAE